VLGTREDLVYLVEKHKVERVFISILSSPARGFEDVFAACETLGVKCTRIQPIIKID
jgi:UDP-GlcNAc:undecaprenyl-phosphate GlcNAc-1-phosphate transferase